MKITFAIFFLFCTTTSFYAQKDWTPWAPVTDSWVEFYVFVDFRGSAKSPAELAKAKLKSLKVDCRFVGRINANIPLGAQGVKVFRINYSEYGRFATSEDFLENSLDVYYKKGVTNVKSVEVTRPAAQFDVAEASKPKAETTIITNVPSIISSMGGGLGPINTKLTGQMYRVECEWRRRGDTVEIKLKEYRPPT